MVSVIPMKEKLMDVKVEELPNWITMQDFTPKVMLEHFKEVTTSMTTSMSI